MVQAYRMEVPAASGNPTAYFRLGTYVSDETVLPGNYTGSASATDGLLMTTTGTFALVAADTGYLQTGDSVDIAVKAGDFSLTASSSLTVTAKSLYLQSGEVVSANSSVPAVSAGQAKIKTDFELDAKAHGGGITITCPASGYEKNISTGFEEVWGNQEKSNGTSNSIVLGALTDIPIGVYPSFSLNRLKLRGQESKMAKSATTMAFLKMGANITKLDNKSFGNTMAQIFTLGTAGHIGKAIAANKAKAAKLDNKVSEVSSNDVGSDLFGVENRTNVAPELNTN